ncbi:Winged helix-turn-helix DNA-binding [Bacteroides luti]|uniref:Winged helix-turn-helix DNA-binding n=1 Tax=Bacteroides luti TaxID=1297750 RepID=A0A1M5A0C1_9BACE|nr:winged helix-turn-helix transcriptional regulator [Bacteroides luti]SHF23708.1 Winged helix-turn-helix DNA-binding [Bacteroides luti]
MNYNANVGNDVGNDMNDREMQLINLIRKEPKITAKDIANILNLSKRQCERIIADLKNKGMLSRRGTNRTGYWKVEDL